MEFFKSLKKQKDSPKSLLEVSYDRTLTAEGWRRKALLKVKPAQKKEKN